MNVFMPIMSQILVLFAFIAIGFILVKSCILPKYSTEVLSKLESFVFVPALVMGTFIKNCTLDNIGALWGILLFSVILLVILLPFAFLTVKFFCKDRLTKNITIYGLVFSNFGFMGNAVVKAIFPKLFFNYIVFTMPFWFAIYAWGVPNLLMPKEKNVSRLKNFINPMLVAMVIGIIIGLTGLTLPSVVLDAVDLLGDCMSPVAMILTGATVATINIKELFKNTKLYLISLIRLVIFPLLYILCVAFIPKGNFINETVLLCGMCMVSMPMGLNAIVIPAAYGEDTTYATGLAVITHLLSVITIPLLFVLFNTWVL